MICRIAGKIVQRKESSLIINVQGLGYEVFIPKGVFMSLPLQNAECELFTFHYLQTDPSKSFPILIGFVNEIEKEFFEKFITVSGIGPKAAVRCLSEPIAHIARAIDAGDVLFLKSLPGIGTQRAREIVAKLQGKVGKFSLIQVSGQAQIVPEIKTDLEQEALTVLLQLQYKKPEAELMVKKAMQRNNNITNSEELLNEVYRQKSKQ
ncbi:MAG: Holliday junction branch migration protein RuvA [Candidatus Omnitrophica bacterium]|nr:Holliday junction branch migration protein RuvA [Candidatus Omnitrophota bacterium]